MTGFDFVFYLFSILTVGSAGLAVLHPNILYAGLSLFGSFFGIAALYLLLGADFLAVSQVLIYVGGILAVILFSVMLSKDIYKVRFKDEKKRKLVPAILSTLVLGILLRTIFAIDWGTISSQEEPAATTGRIGTLLLTDYLLPFELSSILLLAALIGSIHLARRNKDV